MCAWLFRRPKGSGKGVEGALPVESCSVQINSPGAERGGRLRGGRGGARRRRGRALPRETEARRNLLALLGTIPVLSLQQMFAIFAIVESEVAKFGVSRAENGLQKDLETGTIYKATMVVPPRPPKSVRYLLSGLNDDRARSQARRAR